ncbi:sensor histidine kinase [Paenibacillus sp. J31TS4]|uniref:cache domain-containing sensor histidine kinase n=1 Tax=Paenibacillus sp. J31TS4 TaxID=2807195 RepID=UPI001B2971AC|nr:sensor histidine kinase [Paenibacillus sp. J31TS4]GIP37869.1 sensor histidine kinase [Paenibacillus sp. J31TS4]
MSKRSALLRWISPQSSIQGKIFIGFSLVTLISILSISGIVYLNMRETVNHNAVTSVSDSIRQADESLNMILEEIDRLNTVVTTNKNTVIDTVLSPTEEASYEWFLEQNRIEEFLSSLIAYKPYLTRIAVIGLNGKVFFSGSPWIDNTVLGTPMMDYMQRNGTRHAYYTKSGTTDAISVGRELRYNRQTIGVVMIDLNYEFIKKTYGIKPTEDSLLYVFDEQDGIVYQSETAPASEAPSIETIVQMKKEFKGSSNVVEKSIDRRAYTVVSRRSENTGWTTLAMIPMDSLLRESTRLRNMIAEVSVIVFMIVLVGSFQVSSRITSNIRRLRSMMMLVKDGNLVVPKGEMKAKDEVGELYRVFVSMIEELKRLLEGIRISEKQKREAELTALQAQIRPHFLYNALNTIKYLAKLNGAPNIVEVSGSLIELMRGVLGNSNEFISVREELDYVHRYIAIEKYKYMDPIQVETQIEDPALLECRVLKLILQPIVENAIIHGVGSSERERFVLIRVFGEHEDLLIEVTDNGKGMTQEQMDLLIGAPEQEECQSRFSGMGVRNVQERIVRTYGESYGVKIYSEPGLYTKVEIRFPKLWDSHKSNRKES